MADTHDEQVLELCRRVEALEHALASARQAPRFVRACIGLLVLSTGWVIAQTPAQQTFSNAPQGFDVRREGIPQGRVERIEFDSRVTGSKRPVSRPSAASSWTQGESTDATVHSTTTASALFSSRSISVAKRDPL